MGPNEDCIKMAILAPGAIFEVLPRAKKSELGQSKHYTSRTTQNDARNIKNEIESTLGSAWAGTKIAPK